MKTLPLLALLGSVLLLVPAVRADETPGQQMYVRYCGACHGPSGRGDGLAGTFIRPKPTDLTTIARRHHGDFPAAEVAAYIDGTKPVGPHGTREMPVWGELLRDEPGTTANAAQAKVGAIVEYLRTIQRK